MTADKKRELRRLLGETIREIGMLVLVFAPLDAVFARGALTTAQLAGIVVGAVVLVTIGIVAELK